MKNKSIYYIVISGLGTLLLGFSWSSVGFTINKIENQNLSFKAKVNKEVYLLGEAVKIEFDFFNEGESSVIISEGGVEVGSLKVLIANQDGEYKEYFASGWGRLKGSRKTLEPKQSHKYEATILWNGKPNVSHLNRDAARQVLAGKITTEYALPEAGVYFIKGISYVGENRTPTESEPIKIVIEEPIGDDLEVWNQIRGNREIAYLLQKGEFDASEGEKKAKLVSKVEQIIQSYPNSTYSSYLRENIERFKVNEIKRDEFYKNLKQPQNPE